MALRDFSKAGSWTSKLYDILRPAPHPLVTQFSNSQSRFRHLTGDIWRHALSCSVYHDLSGEINDNADAQTKRFYRTWRRFVRMECIGLSGLLFYEIRAPDSRHSQLHDESSFSGNMQHEYNLTAEAVFGDPHDASDAGMEVDDLLDVVQAKVVYFPAYACTSFIIGHAMTAFFRDQPSFRPRPAREGFSVPSFETTDSVPSFYGPEKRGGKVSETISSADPEPILLPSYSWQSNQGEHGVLERFKLDSNDPHVPLCVRSTFLPRTAPSRQAFSDEEDDKEDGNTTSSTIDSVGPPTPPRSAHSQEQNAALTSIDHPFSGNSLSKLDEDDKSIGFNLLPRSIALLKPGSFPKRITGRDAHVSVYHELASFLDLSISQIEMDQ